MIERISDVIHQPQKTPPAAESCYEATYKYAGDYCWPERTTAHFAQSEHKKGVENNAP
jgi:hypothetical protein